MKLERLYTTDPGKQKKVFVGWVKGDKFMRHIKESHFMKTVDGYGIQEDIFKKLLKKKVKFIYIKVIDMGALYSIDIETWRTNSKVMNFGNGKQRFLSLKYMEKIS